MDKLPPNEGGISTRVVQSDELAGKEPQTSATWEQRRVEEGAARPMLETAEPKEYQHKKPKQRRAKKKKSATPGEEAAETGRSPYAQFHDAFYALQWPGLEKYHSEQRKVLDNIQDLMKNPDIKDHPERLAHCWFHLALLYHRLGDREQSESALQTGAQLNFSVLQDELKLAHALLNLDNEKNINLCLSMTDYLASHIKVGTVQPSLKLLELRFHRLPECMQQCSAEITPIVFYTLFLLLQRRLEYSLPEATYTNELELSFQLEKLIVVDGVSGVIDRYIWSAVDLLKDVKVSAIPPLYNDQYLDTTTLLLKMGELWTREKLSRADKDLLRVRLKKLIRVQPSCVVTYEDAVSLMVLAAAHEREWLDNSTSKKAAQLYALAARHPLFTDLLQHAAKLFSFAFCYDEAADCLREFIEKEGEGEGLQSIEKDVHNYMDLAERHRLLITDLSGEGDSTAKTKKKKRHRPTMGRSDKPVEPSASKVASSPSIEAVPVCGASTVDTDQSQPLEQAVAAHPVLPSESFWYPPVYRSVRELRYYMRNNDFQRAQDILIKVLNSTEQRPEKYALHMEAAWLYMEQEKLREELRVTRTKKGQPLSRDELFQKARAEFLNAFYCLTGIRLKEGVSPTEMEQLLKTRYPTGSDRTVPENEKPLREALRRIMSSLGHLYSALADINPKKWGSTSRGFYKLKVLANPEYSKKDTFQPRRSAGVKMITQAEYELIKSSL